jgi:hypothetical protein
MRRNADAIEDALTQLQIDLSRSQVISGGDQLGSDQTATTRKFGP